MAEKTFKNIENILIIQMTYFLEFISSQLIDAVVVWNINNNCDEHKANKICTSLGL